MVADLIGGRTVVITDTSQDPRTRDVYDVEYGSLGVGSFIRRTADQERYPRPHTVREFDGPRTWTPAEATWFPPWPSAPGLPRRNAQLYQAARQEIAERRRAEERYRTLTDSIASVVWTTGPNGLFDQPQPSWEAYTGQGWEEHKEGRAIAALHPDDREQASASGIRQCAPWLRSRRSSGSGTPPAINSAGARCAASP